MIYPKFIKDLRIWNYTCPKFGYHLNRDYNADLNIMYEWLKQKNNFLPG